jgi:hypothetical protein
MRRLRLKTWTGRLGLVALFMATSVMAQPADETKTGDETAKPDAEVKFRKASQLTAEEQATQANAYITKMKSTQVHVSKMAGKARKDKDIIKLNCVNDKLIQIKGHLNLAERGRDSLKVAAQRRDDGARQHEFAKLTITYQKVVVLGQEAEACIGEDISFVGKTKVEVEMDKDIPQEDPTVTPDPPLPIVRIPVVRPPLASPFF